MCFFHKMMTGCIAECSFTDSSDGQISVDELLEMDKILLGVLSCVVCVCVVTAVMVP